MTVVPGGQPGRGRPEVGPRPPTGRSGPGSRAAGSPPAGGADPAAVDVAVECLGGLGRRNGPLGALTTYRVGGDAAVLVTVGSHDDLARVAEAARTSGLAVLVVGRGSNMLVSDAGFGGIAVVLDADGFGQLGFEDHEGAAVVRAGGALPLPALARRSVEAGVRGLEWAVGVPGSVGGGVRMNAGGHGSDMAASTVAVTLVDLSGASAGIRRQVPAADLGLRYRRSSVGAAQVVVEAELRADWGEPGAGRELLRGIVRWRREHQPGGQNAGSVFTNPVAGDTVPAALVPGDARERPSAGALIEAAGLKGHRLGSACVSAKHANFIQADPGGSADDVYELLVEVRARVAERFGVDLRTEIRLIGFEPSSSTGGLC